MNSSNFTKEQRLIDQLKDEIPDLSPVDVVSLLQIIERLEKIKYLNLYKQHKALLDWFPSKSTVLEILKLSVEPRDIAPIIDGFKAYASRKSWGLNDGLDEKLITHTNYLIKTERVRLKPESPDNLC